MDWDDSASTTILVTGIIGVAVVAASLVLGLPYLFVCIIIGETFGGPLWWVMQGGWIGLLVCCWGLDQWAAWRRAEKHRREHEEFMWLRDQYYARDDVCTERLDDLRRRWRRDPRNMRGEP